MRILLLTQIAPNPPNAGPKVKTHYVLRTLAEEHEVELITFARSPDEIKHAQLLREWCSNVTTIQLDRNRIQEPLYAARGWSQLNPFLVARDYRAAFSAAVRRRLDAGTVDAVHADQLSMAQYLDLAHRPAYPAVRRVFDAHNAVWELVRELAPRQSTPAHRAAAEIEWRLLRRFEGRVARASSLTLCVSNRDRIALENAAGKAIRTAVIPIGVEVRDQSITPFNPDARRLLSIATMHYPPNAEAIRWFASDVWPGLRQTRPDVGVDVVGARPPGDIVDLAASDSSISIHGFVENVDSLYSQAAVFIVPLRAGSGVRVKILEAMARGVPVVSTSIGADGLDVEHGTHLLVADTPADFARAVTTLLEQPELRRSIAQAARQRALALYDWRQCCQPLLDIYRGFDVHRTERPASLLTH
ncbi:MAG TPA: glycosyltransferase family 4 protein [Thermomicrobiales bacterium]|nr:glycosyltransferase family 4 protein [Thermomicrobiales bacterium]